MLLPCVFLGFCGCACPTPTLPRTPSPDDSAAFLGLCLGVGR